MGFGYIFDYGAEADQFFLWYALERMWYEPGGSGKVFWCDAGNMCLKNEFYQLDQNGREICRTFIFVEKYLKFTKH